MLTVCYLLAFITVVFAVTCILFRRKGKSFEGMICKFMASFGFISTAIVGYCYNPANVSYFCLVSFALLFGFCGDIILGIKEIAPKFREKLVPLGTFYFLVGHVFFLIAFLRRGGFSLPALIAALLFGVGAIILIKVLKMKLDIKMKILLTVYYTVLIYKASSAAFLMISQGDTAFILSFIGSLLFVFSDTCLGLIYFTPVKKKNQLVTFELSTYYTAQIFLSLSMAFIK